jgi:hypothetical protein
MRTHRDGRVVYQVQFRREVMTYLDRFPEERVRLDTVDRSRAAVSGALRLEPIASAPGSSRIVNG